MIGVFAYPKSVEICLAMFPAFLRLDLTPPKMSIVDIEASYQSHFWILYPSSHSEPDRHFESFGLVCRRISIQL